MANEDKEDLEQLWKFSSIKFIDNQIHVNITNAKDGEKFCLSSNVGTGSQTGRPGINVCDNHQGWILDYDAAEYEGSVRMRVPRTNLCLYRIELLVPQANMMKNSNSSSPSTKTSTTMIASGDDDDSSRKLDDGFRVESCDKESPEDLMSMFKFKVLLEDSMVMAAATATAKKDVE